MNSIEIRPTLTADLDVLARILAQVHELDGYPVEGVDDPRAWLELPHSIGQWTALLDGKPVGHAALLRPQPSDGAPLILAKRDGLSLGQMAVLAKLFVAPLARGHSVANRLMDVAEDEARSAEIRLALDVMAKDRSAISLYQRRGWCPIGSSQHLYGAGRSEPAIAMRGPE